MITWFLFSNETFLFLRQNKMLYKQKAENPYEQSKQDGTEKKNSNYCDSSSNGRDSAFLKTVGRSYKKDSFYLTL